MLNKLSTLSNKTKQNKTKNQSIIVSGFVMLGNLFSLYLAMVNCSVIKAYYKGLMYGQFELML